MLAGLKRDLDSDGVSELSGPHAASEDDRLRLHETLLSVDPVDATVAHREPFDGNPFDEGGPPLFGALGERHRRVDWGGHPVVRDVERPDQIIDVQKWTELEGLVEVDLTDLDADSAGHGDTPQEFLPPLLIGRHRDRPGRAIPRRLTGLRLQFLEQASRVGGESGEAVARFELTDETRGMPGGATGQLALLEHEHIGHVPTGQVVGDRRSDDAATDDHHLGAGGHGHERSPLVGVTASVTDLIGHIGAETTAPTDPREVRAGRPSGRRPGQRRRPWSATILR